MHSDTVISLTSILSIPVIRVTPFGDLTAMGLDQFSVCRIHFSAFGTGEICFCFHDCFQFPDCFFNLFLYGITAIQKFFSFTICLILS